MADKNILKSIPKVDEVLRFPALEALSVSRACLTDSVRDILGNIRAGILSGELENVPSTEEICALVLSHTQEKRQASLRGVINGTGIVLHTNLGRAPMSAEAAEAAAAAAKGYSTLEYDLEKGCRGSRHSHVEPLLTSLTGAEAAMAVNNNAAAVLLILSALGSGKEAIVSRGELVEIGGSFRVPDIMEACGCILREVGTTNKTHLSDYERAIGENTFALMKVHTSNFRIVGFSESADTASLAALAHGKGLPLIYDLGSGSLVPSASYGISGEPDVPAAVADGADIICFSGDKLLGGPQAGIIVGKKHYIDIIKSHPLARAMRIDKMTLAALEATLRIYADGESVQKIPVLSMLSASPEKLRERAEALSALLREKGIGCETVGLSGQVGGGSAPTTELESRGVAVISERLSVNALEDVLRRASVPVIGRIVDDRFCLDVRTIRDVQLAEAAEAIAEVLS